MRTPAGSRSLVMVAAARLVLAIVPLAHLILSPIHVAALLKLENEICGFIMFLSILSGLMVLFQATRMRSDHLQDAVLTQVVTIVVIALTVWLSVIYGDALRNQVPLSSPETVKKALTLGYVIAGCYGAASLVLLLDVVVHKPKGCRTGASHG